MILFTFHINFKKQNLFSGVKFQKNKKKADGLRQQSTVQQQKLIKHQNECQLKRKELSTTKSVVTTSREITTYEEEDDEDR